MAELVVLGSGTSNGVPSLGVDYPASFLANPKNHRYRSSIILKGPTGNVLVDCTPEMRLQLLRADIKRLEAVIITHTHADHVMGMDDLRAISLVQGAPVPIYSFPEHLQAIRGIYPYAFQEFPPGIQIPRFDLKEITPQLELGGMTIHTLPVEHGSMRVVGLRVNKTAYLTDVSRIPEEALVQLRDLDTLIIDAVRYKPHPNHFHFVKALEVIADLKPKMAYLTHLCDDYDHDVVEATLPSNIRLSYDGLTLQI